MIDTKATQEKVITVKSESSLMVVKINANLTAGRFSASISHADGFLGIVFFNSFDELEDAEMVLHDALKNYKKVLYGLG